MPGIKEIKIISSGFIAPNESKIFKTTKNNNSITVVGCKETSQEFITKSEGDKLICSEGKPFNGKHNTDWQAGGKFTSDVTIENLSDDIIKVVLSEIIVGL